MKDLLSTDKLLLFFVFFVPGLVSFKVWTLVVPTVRAKLSDRALEILTFGCMNFAALFWLVEIAVSERRWIQYPMYFIVLLVMPVVWPFVVRWFLTRKFVRKHIIHPIPRAWDWFFGLGMPCFILVHLKNGKLIGGLYSANSFASSFPNTEDLYIEEVWSIDGTGRFNRRISDSSGILISGDSIEYLEFFRASSERNAANDANDAQEKQHEEYDA